MHLEVWTVLLPANTVHVEFITYFLFIFVLLNTNFTEIL